MDTKCEPFDICLSNNRKQFLKQSLPQNDQLIQTDSTIMGNGEVLRPGMVLLKRYIPISQQVEIALKCRELGLGSGSFSRPVYKDGAKLRLHMMCLGLDWDPQTRKYGRKREHDNSMPPDIPFNFRKLVKRELQDSHILIKQKTGRNYVEKILPRMATDVCIVNFYTMNGLLGSIRTAMKAGIALTEGYQLYLSHLVILQSFCMEMRETLTKLKVFYWSLEMS